MTGSTQLEQAAEMGRAAATRARSSGEDVLKRLLGELWIRSDQCLVFQARYATDIAPCQDPANGKASDVVSAGEEDLTCHSLVLDVRAQ